MTVAEALAAALQHHVAGNLQPAEVLYRQILQTDSTHSVALHGLGLIAQHVGRLDLAIGYMQQSVGLQPLNATFQCDLAQVFIATGDLEKAATHFRQALQLRPDDAEILNNLGVVLSDQGKLDEAVANYERALQLSPNNAYGRSNLAAGLQKLGRLDESAAHCLEAIRLQPDNVEAWNNLGVTQRYQERLDESVSSCRKALDLQPNFVMAHSNLGITLQLQGKLDEAEACYRKAVQIKPDFVGGYENLAVLLQTRGRLDEAEACLQEALRFQPNHANVLNSLGGVQLLQGKHQEALDSYLKALRVDINDADIASNILLCLNYDPTIEAVKLFEEHRRWGAHFGSLRRLDPGPAHDRAPTRPLRIGYVSPDLNWHPIAHFLQPILAHHDRELCIPVCYVEVATADAMTERLRGLCPDWRSLKMLDSRKAAELIQSDRIDILVDLSGHTAKNRLLLFALKPAPVQVTYLGYPNTTGLATVDYLLSDAIVHPPGQLTYCTEEVYRLPHGFSCFSPPSTAPEVGPLPATRYAYVTFGSLHSLARLNETVLDLWGELLRVVPSARLLIFRHTLQGAVRENLRQRLIARGVAPKRVELRQAEVSQGSHLQLYHDIDISLDTFPWSGHTTACESLWMGVPVVTLRGARHAGRMVASVLTQVGLPDLIADIPGQYVAMAARLAQDVDRLHQLRLQLRDQMRQSPLCDGKGFVRILEAAYREMWTALKSSPRI